MSEQARIALDLIHPSPTNPRKTFKRDELEELAVSIKAHDVINAVKVRPHPTLNHGSFMLIHGERRWRAAKIAGLIDIPAIIEELDETQVLEQQLIENSQRVDVHPLEEAVAYQSLLDHHGYTMDTLTEKTGRSRAHLYGRLKLLKLAAGPRKAFLEGTLTASVAEMIARIPVSKLQEQALKDVLGQGPDITYMEADVQAETIDPEVSNLHRSPLSFRAAATLIHRRYTLKLELAKFPTADPRLVPEAGACGDCEHRTGNQPSLPGVDAPPTDLCTNPPCFEAKTKAAWVQAAAAAKARGIEVVEKKKAEGVFDHSGTRVSGAGPYVDLDTELPYDLQKQPGAKATFGKLLGRNTSEVPRVLVQDESGAPRELLDKKAAIEILRDLGKIDKPTKPGAATATASAAKKDKSKEKDQLELKEQAFKRVLATLVDAVDSHDLAQSGKKTTAAFRWIASQILEHHLDYGADAIAAERRGLTGDPTDAMQKVIDAAKSGSEIVAIIVELLVAGKQDQVIDGFNRKIAKSYEEICELFGVDRAKALALAKEAAKSEAKLDEKKAKTKKGAK